MAKSKITYSSSGHRFPSATSMLNNALERKTIEIIEDRLSNAGLLEEARAQGMRIVFNPSTSKAEIEGISDDMVKKIEALFK